MTYVVYIVEICSFKIKTIWQFNGMPFVLNKCVSFPLRCPMDSTLKIEVLTLTNKEAHKGKLELTQNFLPVFRKKNVCLTLKAGLLCWQQSKEWSCKNIKSLKLIENKKMELEAKS